MTSSVLARRGLSLLALGAILVAARAVSADLKTKAAPALDPAWMDKTCSACDDFNRYANGGWQAKNPVPADHPPGAASRFSRSATARRCAESSSGPPPTQSAAPGSDERKIGDFYASCMDEARIEAEGIHPLDDELGRIAKLSNAAELQAEIARLHARGVRAVFLFGSQQDRRDSSEVIAAASQGGLGLPDRDYYTKTDDKSTTLRKELRGPCREDARARRRGAGGRGSRREDRSRDRDQARRGLDDARRAARPGRDVSPHGGRGPRSSVTPNFDWTAYFHGVDAPAISAVNVAQPKFFERDRARSSPRGRSPTGRPICAGTCCTPRRPPCPGSSSRRTSTSSSGRFRAPRRCRPRWKRCVAATDTALGVALGPRLREGVLPARGEGAGRPHGQEPRRGARRRPAAPPLDGRGDAESGAREAQGLHAEDRLSRQVARLLRARRRPRTVRRRTSSAPALSRSTAISTRSASRSTAASGA